MTLSTSTTAAYNLPHWRTSEPSSPKSSSPKSLSLQSQSPKLSSSSTTLRAIDHIFVLWGEHFFESAAVIFATMFREAGLCVKLVGVSGMQAAGRNRISVQADLSMTNALALARRVCAIVLPCSPAALRRMGNDPRIHQLFLQATGNEACFLVPPEMSTTANSLKFLGVPPQLVLQYAAEPALISFVQQLAPQLAGIISNADQQPGALAKLRSIQNP